MIKAIFFDIDGTLVSFRTHRISPAVLDGLRRLQAKGVKLFIATGRQLEAARAAAGGFPFDGWITVSGQYCLAGDRVLRSNPIPPEWSARLIDLLERYGVTLCCYGHLHGYAIRRRWEGKRGETDFSLISADYLGFVPKKICD